VSVLDGVILLFVIALAWRGARTGFVAGALSLAGVILGAALGSRLAPALLGEYGERVFGPVLTLAAILAFAILGDMLGRIVGGLLREGLRGSFSRTVDGVGGALLGTTLSLVLVSIGAALLSGTLFAGALRPAMDDSRVLATLEERVPSRLITRAVAQLDPIPQLRGPRAETEEPDAGIAADPEVQAAASRTVRVSGIACGYGVEGSGWVAGDGLVVTNAHVVAGEETTRVQPEGRGLPLPAHVIVFDERNDVAVLRVPRLRGVAPLPLAEPERGEPVAILGFPENGPYDVTPGRVGDTLPVVSGDAYNRGPVERTVTSFRGHVRPGNSGGPAVDADGNVVATVFAARADSEDSGYGVPSQLVAEALEVAETRRGPVDTGECASY
jgi:S1-C subfamily serine protease